MSEDIEFRDVNELLEEQFLAGIKLLPGGKRESVMDYIRYLLHRQEEEE